jgi:hypothetical protein
MQGIPGKHITSTSRDEARNRNISSSSSNAKELIMLARMKAVGTRITLLAATLALLVAINPGTAAASNGFCQGVYITSNCTGPGPGPVTQIDAEVLEGSATICVRLNEGDGVFVYKSCGVDRASHRSLWRNGIRKSSPRVQEL